MSLICPECRGGGKTGGCEVCGVDYNAAVKVFEALAPAPPCATFHTLPVWKKNSTTAEWLEELAGLAREHPEQWVRVVVVFEEADAAQNRWHQRGYESNTDVIGTLQWALLEVFEYMKGRRR